MTSLVVIVLPLLSGLLGSPGESPSVEAHIRGEIARRNINHRWAASMGLEGVLARIHGNPDSLDRYRTLEEGETRSLDVDGLGPCWIWRDGNDLVVAIDENGDAPAGSQRPDSLEDVTVIDYDSDGNIDRILDWVDADGDGAADRQILYALTSAPVMGTAPSCAVVEHRDRQRGFWHLERWQYVQSLCQWRSDFSGDLFHVFGRYDERRRLWHSFGENPFCFYDPDGDGLSEEALLLAGVDTSVRHMRWSFDADNDATERHPYDYDLSVTAHGRQGAPASFCDTIPLRGGGLPVVRWEKARDFARSVRWRKALLTFDEEDRNVDPHDEESRERWEGVISDAVGGFPALGSPGCGPFNKRYELNGANEDTLLLYVSWADERIHLFGAEEGWIRIDENRDGVCDGALRMEDENQDGLFDTWMWDGDGDGEFETIFRDFDALWDPLPLRFEDVEAAQQSLLARWRRTTGSDGGQAERFWSDVRRWREKGRPLD